MPYQCKDNFELFKEYIGIISALMEESPTSNIAIIIEVILMQLLLLNLMSNYRNYVTI